MNTFTEQAKAMVQVIDQPNLKRELDCIAILQSKTELDLALGNIDDAMEHARDMMKSLKSIKQMALNKELADIVMTTERHIRLQEYLNYKKIVWIRGR